MSLKYPTPIIGTVPIKHVESAIALPFDQQARYKPAGFTIVSITATVSGNSADVSVPYYSALEAELKVTAVSGTAPSLNVYIQGKFDSTGDYKDLATLTNITATGVYFFSPINPLVYNNIRARWEITGTAPSFTFTVAGQAIV
jgi:hypothetical protein